MADKKKEKKDIPKDEEEKQVLNEEEEPKESEEVEEIVEDIYQRPVDHIVFKDHEAS